MKCVSSSNSSTNPNFLLFFSPLSHSLQSPHSLLTPRCSSSSSSSSAAALSLAASESLPAVRRPRKGVTPGEGGEDEEEEYDDESRSTPIDAGLAEMARKLAVFDPGERVGTAESSPEKVPLVVNLDLALYRAKLLTRNFKFAEAEEILRKCISYWREDGRSYVLLGKALSKQSKNSEARNVYEKGCQATQGENPYIWQCWAVFENKMGNIRRARELFDAATVADKKHIAAWHGWAMLELKQGNIRKARSLLAKALKFCKGNEYVYQTLAMLEAKASRFEQARYLFKQATKCNPQSCASWLAWAQMEMQQENNRSARRLFEKAIQASPKNRFAWHVWGVFEAKVGNVDMGRKLLKIGHTLNPKDPVLLQSLALLEYKHSSANIARNLFRQASELDPRHQPVWMAWGWMEWKEGNISTARELYQKALSIDSTSDTAARCLQAWGVLEQRLGNLSAARRFFRSSLNIDSQSFITWMTWASFEEAQGNSVRAEEIRNLYLQQRTEIVDDASWVMGFLDSIDPAIDRVKKLLKIKNSKEMDEDEGGDENERYSLNEDEYVSPFDLNAFLSEKLALDPRNLAQLLEISRGDSSPPTVNTRPFPTQYLKT